MCRNLSWPEYTFLPSGGRQTVAPADAERFFSDNFRRMVPDYRMIAFEVDFLITTFQTTAQWSQDVSSGSEWIAGLARAGLRYSTPVQLCTQTPRFNLESVRHAAYTNARASDDFVTASQPFPRGNLFPVGYTSTVKRLAAFLPRASLCSSPEIGSLP